MKKYQVIITVSSQYSITVLAESPEAARKVAQNRNPYSGEALGSRTDYEVVDNDFDSTN